MLEKLLKSNSKTAKLIRTLIEAVGGYLLQALPQWIAGLSLDPNLQMLLTTIGIILITYVFSIFNVKSDKPNEIAQSIGLSVDVPDFNEYKNNFNLGENDNDNTISL